MDHKNKFCLNFDYKIFLKYKKKMCYFNLSYVNFILIKSINFKKELIWEWEWW